MWRVETSIATTNKKGIRADPCCNPITMHIVGLAGPPGAGKSTIASEIAKRVNKLWCQKSRSFDSQVEPPEVAIVLPMDGFHLYRHQLDAMEDPEEAHARRGAPWTFDPNLLLECLKTLKDQGSVYCPSFDHGVGDPVEDDIFVNLQHKIVIVEGNYLLLGDGAWKELSSMFDEKWFIDVDIEKAMQRVLKRHISTGKLPDAAKWRIDYNDRPNAELIMKSKKNADLVIKSIDELRALDKINKAIVDNATGGSFVKSSYGVASNVLDQVASLARGWHMKDAEVAMGAPYSSFVCQD
ncbi:putative E3 ubiquitin-protein ligase RGLG1-like isoform X1 [Capsicum annuum]|nr:putative E3 ubiquitin-protein ligase RGLG1-like isoform X1 [Capsicum annuum]